MDRKLEPQKVAGNDKRRDERTQGQVLEVF